MGTSTQSVETISIVDAGSDLKITYNLSHEVFLLKKSQVKIRKTEEYVYLTNANGFQNNWVNQVLRLSYEEISTPSGLTSNDDLFLAIVDMIGVLMGTYEDISTYTDSSATAATKKYAPPLYMEGWRNLALEIEVPSSSSEIKVRIFGTLDPNAAVPSAGNDPSYEWVAITKALTGVDELKLDGESALIFIDTPQMFDRIIVQYLPANSTNSIIINSRRY